LACHSVRHCIVKLTKNYRFRKVTFSLLNILSYFSDTHSQEQDAREKALKRLQDIKERYRSTNSESGSEPNPGEPKPTPYEPEPTRVEESVMPTNVAPVAAPPQYSALNLK